MFPNPADDGLAGNALCAKAIHRNGNRFCHADGVGQLNLHPIGIALAHDVLGNLARYVGCAAIHLRGILAGKGTAAMTAGSAVGVGDNLAARHTCVGKKSRR